MIPVMRIVSVGIIFSIDGQLVDCFFRSLNLVKVGFYLRLFGLVVSVIGIFIGSSYGITGVASAIVISNILIIIVKMIVLSSLVDASIFTMFSKWLIAWKPALIPAVLGAVYLFILPHGFVMNILFLVLQLIVISSEMLLFPKLIGDDYSKIVYPMVGKIVRIPHKNIFS